MKCPQCGMNFTPASRSQTYCTRECRRKAQKERANERMRELNAEITACKPKPRPVSPKTDWGAIGRLMAETNKSYGQLQKEGML